MYHLFERPLPSGWVYPCSVEDIQQKLAQLPPEDLTGLWAVGLVPATRRKNDRYGSYCFHSGEKPDIHLYSLPQSLSITMKALTPGQVEHSFAVELAFGMDIDTDGSKTVCQWQPEPLRRYIIEHVLLHEIGHHVQYMQRHHQGHKHRLSSAVREQFAEDYALRHLRKE